MRGLYCGIGFAGPPLTETFTKKLIGSGVLTDVRGVFDSKETTDLGIYYYHL